MSDIKPLNWTTKTLARISRLSLGLPSTVHIGSNEMLSYRVGRCLCRHSLTSMRYTAVDVHYAEMQAVHTFLWPLSPSPFNFGYRCFGLYRHSLTLGTLSRSLVRSSFDTLYRVSKITLVNKDFVPWGKMSVSDVFLYTEFKCISRISLSPTPFAPG